MMNFEAADTSDNAWRFCLSTRLTGAYPKPVLLRSSWGRFVEQKGLAPDDRVVFFMERDEANDMIRRYTLRAQRKVMVLMGVAGDVQSQSLRSWKLETFYELQNIVKKTVEGNNSYTHSHREANHAGDQLAKNSVNPT
ncbi:hypothetical protein D5086_006071 [Populus alba]|uniref:Uncharacterized protein n=1 Tax=Populus alba TaxID=43335 RepID=A0ACC4CJP7_POPAL